MSRGVRASWSGPLGVYSPGTSLLHRVAPGWKLLGLLAASVLLTFWRSPLVALGVLAIMLLLLWRTGAAPRSTARTLAVPTSMAVILGLFQWWSRDLQSAVVTSCALLALVVGATVVTASTRSDDLLDAVVVAARPLRRAGLSPQTLAMTIALMLRTVPTLAELSGEVRDAARARGLDRSARAHLVPFALRAVAHAHRTADALAARGILDDDPELDESAPTGRSRLR